MVTHLNGPWRRARGIIGERRLTLGPQASQQYLDAPDHLTFVLARYRAAAALIGNAQRVLEVGCGEGIGTGLLAKGRSYYCGIDSDAEALMVARELAATDDDPSERRVEFLIEDILTFPGLVGMDAAVSLDVAEHILPADEDEYFRSVCRSLGQYSRFVVGTPSAHMNHLASPQSRAGHVNLFTPERLQARLERHFHATQIVFMQDVSIHLGHPAAAHYILGVGFGPRL